MGGWVRLALHFDMVRSSKKKKMVKIPGRQLEAGLVIDIRKRD